MESPGTDVAAESVDLLKQIVHVFDARLLALQSQPEEVRQVELLQRIVLDEALASRLEALEDCLVHCNLHLVIPLLFIDAASSESRWRVPEVDVDAHGLADHRELLRLLLDLHRDVLGLINGAVRNLSEALDTMLLHGQPQLEAIRASSATQSLVTDIVLRVLGLVEKVLSARRV